MHKWEKREKKRRKEKGEISTPPSLCDNVLASQWELLPSLGHRSTFSASSSVQLAPVSGEEFGGVGLPGEGVWWDMWRII